MAGQRAQKFEPGVVFWNPSGNITLNLGIPGILGPAPVSIPRPTHPGPTEDTPMNRPNRRTRRRFPFPLSPTLALLLPLLFWPSPLALAIDQAGYTTEVLVGGTPLQEYLARSATYVEALRGREYSIRAVGRFPCEFGALRRRIQGMSR